MRSAMSRIWIALGGIAGLLAVGMAAWAAHGLPQRLDPARLAMVHSAVTQQGWHALALLAAGLLEPRFGWPARLAGLGFALGLLLFCGAVYAAALGGVSLGPVAPTGGMLLMAGWACLVVAALRGPVAGR
jgi:uncharacterized membrane protein YgdD (TMEM256/DUF423 family)